VRVGVGSRRSASGSEECSTLTAVWHWPEFLIYRSGTFPAL